MATVTSTSAQSASFSTGSMPETVQTPVLPFHRQRPPSPSFQPSARRASPYDRLAQELGYARAKTARDNVAVAYKRVALTNRVLIEAGMQAKVGELMAVIEASLMGETPPLEEAIHAAQCADAEEDKYEAEFIYRAGDHELEGWIKKLAAEVHSAEVLLKALITERDARRARTEGV